MFENPSPAPALCCRRSWSHQKLFYLFRSSPPSTKTPEL